MVVINTPTTSDHWLPSGNPIVFTIATTDTYPRLSYIIDVYVNGAVAAQLKYPVYNSSRIDIDVRKIVNDYLDDTFVNDDILTATNTLIYPQNETASVYIAVREEYFDGTSMVISGILAQSKELYVWRAAAEFQDARKVWEFENDFQFDIYTHYRSFFPKFLGPQIEGFDYANNVEKSLYVGDPNFFKARYKVSMNTIRTVSFFTYGYSAAPVGAITDEFYVWCYDKNFNRTKEFKWVNPEANNYVIADYIKKVSQFPCSPANLNNVPWSGITLYNSATLNYIDPSEDKYYVIFTHEGDDFYGEWGIRAIPFEIVCNQYDTYDILYKTREGGWWQIRADRKSFRETSVDTSVMYNTWSIGAQQPVPNSKRFKQTMHTNADGSITLNTDWLNSQYFIDEIEDMIVSPQIYLIKEGATPQYIPVVLKDKTHKIWNKNQEKLIQYEFEFEEAYKKATLI